MNVIYVTDDRTSYKQGNYYCDWIKIFLKNHRVEIWDPLGSEPDTSIIKKADIFVIGHGAVDHLTSPVRRRLNPFGSPSRFLRNIRKVQVGGLRLMFSKNDYKDVAEKARIAKELNVDLIVTHSKRAIDSFREYTDIAVTWVPFGVDLDVFRNLKNNRDIKIGFRGNSSDKWNGGERRRFVEEVQRLYSGPDVDIAIGNNGENFLHGEKYVSWLNRCHLIINTPSALNTTGPRFWEAIACGAVPVAPINEYEGMMLPDVHYLAIEGTMKNLEEKIELFFSDRQFRRQLEDRGKEILETINMDFLHRRLLEKLSRYS